MNYLEKQASVCYYYMPSKHERPAEIIIIINNNTGCIQVPVREEDLKLYAIHKREMTAPEIAVFGKKQAWRIFKSWEELVADHLALDVGQEAIEKLNELKITFKLEEGITV